MEDINNRILITNCKEPNLSGALNEVCKDRNLK